MLVLLGFADFTKIVVVHKAPFGIGFIVKLLLLLEDGTSPLVYTV